MSKNHPVTMEPFPMRNNWEKTIVNIIKEKVQLLPSLPGVYIMKDSRGDVLYVGKAGSLKNRVRSYFRKTSGQSPKTVSLLSHLSDIDYMVTSSEVEALILENNLIKRHRPRYNVVLRDDKNYPYLRLSSEEYPRLTVVRSVRNDKASYFGPYTSAASMRETLKLIRTAFPIRDCSDDIFRGRKRPCLSYQIRRCSAPCVRLVSKDEYGDMVSGIRMFLEGKDRELMKNLVKKMEDASRRLEFEHAARIRDRINAIKKVLERQNVVSGRLTDQDCIAIARDTDEVQVMVIFIRGGKVTGNRSFHFSNLGDVADPAVLTSFIAQFYSGEKFIPPEIVIPVEIGEKRVIEDWLAEKRGRVVKLFRPVRGARLRVMGMARKNAELALKDHLGLEESGIRNLKGLRDELQLKNIPHRIEAFDISNIGGKEAVASMVFFENGMPRKDGYRHFKIKTVQGANDYGMMAEVLMRHYGRLIADKTPLPDLMMVDGGKGQLNVALSVARELGLEGIDIISLAKERKGVPDRVFIPKAKDAVRITGNSSIMHLLQFIRDESHRFAITYHRKLRGERFKMSGLSDVPGIGDKKAKALLKNLKSMDKIKEADVETLSAIPGISKKDAAAVYSHFHP